MRRVVVTGLGIISPVGHNLQESWAAAVAGRSGVGPIEGFDASAIDVAIAGEVRGFDFKAHLPAPTLRKSTRFVHLALIAAAEAVQDAGLPAGEGLERVGCSVGVGIGGLETIHTTGLALEAQGQRKVSPFFIPQVIANMAAGHVSMTHGLKGPNICTSTACTSGTHAVGEAWLYIRSGMAEAMVCGGSESVASPLTFAGFANMKALSRRQDQPHAASRPFDRDRDGFVIGEGAGMLVLEEFEHARRRGAHIYGEIAGYGLSGDAHHITAPPAAGEGAQRCMRAALASAEVNVDQVQYINAHGTSTHYNDLYESQAIEAVFGAHAKDLAVSSTKGVTGHCLGAAGGIEAVFLMQALKEGVVPPTAHLENVDPECHLDYVPREARDLAFQVGMSNSFGFGGTNGCLVARALL